MVAMVFALIVSNAGFRWYDAFLDTYATAGIGRMAGVLIAGFLWSWGGIAGVAVASAGFTFLGLLAVLWGLHGWAPQGSLEKRSP